MIFKKFNKANLIFVILLMSIIPSAAAEMDSTWTPISPMTTVRSSFSSLVMEGKIYAIGGISYGSKLMDIYDPVTDVWTQKTIPGSANYSEATAIDDKIYIVDGGSSVAGNNVVYIYNTLADSWDTTNNIIPRVYHQVAVVNDKLYVIGGHNIINNVVSTLDSVEMYDPSTGNWTTKASMNLPREKLKVEVVNGKIYAIGGYTPGNWLTSVEEYDPVADTWTTKADMNIKTAYFESAVLNNKIYISGGDGSSTHLNQLQAYDPETNIWTIKAPMLLERENHQFISADNKLYAVGGSNNTGISAAAESYDPTTDSWESIASLPKAKRYAGSALLDNSIYVFGGLTDDKQESNNNESRTAAKYTIPSPSSPEVSFNLSAVGGDAKVDLNWNSVPNSTSYNIYRSTTIDGSYTMIAKNIAGTSYTDTDVSNGTTYYYVVTAVTAQGESEYSNKASATPQLSSEAGFAILDIYMVDGTLKEYDLSMTKVDEFIAWYDAKASGTGKNYFIIEKSYNKGPFKYRKDYIIFDKIKDFEVNQYN
ncbi:kelch repeat-containing protein [Oscillibacter sp.]|uniref:Kelch repeat-containing protein n=1 Tax=Oscillibacter sp. TaxID=1945593 RepID=UPI00289B538E|nr:kelch repeat-containing protein [Oscillibacter sp.]